MGQGIIQNETAVPVDSEVIEADLCRHVVGAAMTVLNTLRPGLDEKLYERALVIELAELGLKSEQQRRYPVSYRDRPVGTLIPDLTVESRVIVDAKVVESFNDHHVAQMLGYLAITGMELALLVNFKYARLEWKRVVRSQSDIRVHSRDSRSRGIE